VFVAKMKKKIYAIFSDNAFEINKKTFFSIVKHSRKLFLMQTIDLSLLKARKKNGNGLSMG
jgi:hypothetical protein